MLLVVLQGGTPQHAAQACLGGYNKKGGDRKLFTQKSPCLSPFLS